MSQTTRSITRVQGFKDAEMDFQLLRQLGSAFYGGASIGETLYAAASMKEETPSEWVAAFVRMAKELERDALMRQEKNHIISAKEQFFKACNAYRAAEYYLKLDDEQHMAMGLLSRECFMLAMNLSSYSFVADFVEYNGLKLPYYFIKPNDNIDKIVIIVSGFDGTTEESFFQSGISALERGYGVVCFAGPGQMDSARFNDTHFEPDFEKPISALLDRLVISQNITCSNIALYGISFGGYFATRAACYEPRIKALIANSPIVNLHSYMTGFVGYDPANIPDNEDFYLADIASISDEECPPNLKESLYTLMQRFGNKSFKNTFIYLKSFNVENIIGGLTMPCLALVGDGEGGEPISQHRYFCENIQNISEHIFTQNEGADMHCQLGNLNLSNCVIYDWLDEVFAR